MRDKLIYLSVGLCLTFCTPSFGQTGKQMDHEDFRIWNRITETDISNDGQWISYVTRPGEGDPTVQLYDLSKQTTTTFDRASQSIFTADNRFLIFKRTPAEDSIKALKRQKVDEKDLPGDTLCIYDLQDKSIVEIPKLQSFSVPEEWSGCLFYQVKDLVIEQDSMSDDQSNKGSKKKGYPLIVMDLKYQNADTIHFVKDYRLAKSAPEAILYSTGRDSLFQEGVYAYSCGQGLKPIMDIPGKYQQLSIDESGQRMSFIGDQDTTDARIRPYQLFHYATGMNGAEVLVDGTSAFLPSGWNVSEHATPRYSKNGKYLHFGIAPPPILEDTTLLKDEIVQVEVWHYNDPLLHTQQKVRLSNEKKRSYLSVYDIENKQIHQIASTERKESVRDQDLNSPIIVSYESEPYLKASSWTGDREKDIYLTSIKTGETKLIGKQIEGSPRISPSFNYVQWYNAPDTSWFVYHVRTERMYEITPTLRDLVHDELNDRPAYPNDYGVAGWTKNDASILIYDRYDIWSVDPTGKGQPKNLTNGREDLKTYRYVRLDPEERSIDPDQPMLLHVFDHKDKSSGYAQLNLNNGKIKMLDHGPFRYDRRPRQSKNGKTLVFTKETFREFPDLQVTTNLFKSSRKISDVNFQQKDYRWGNIEIYEWTAYDGQKMKGLLVKPDGFDPNRKYPMIVNFYERSTDGLHNYRHPAPHRSTINYPFYTSRGYVIFNPDVHYKIGYPGESAYNSAVSGTEALIEEGFIDASRVALQGHSWGGYQIAHILTKTNIYKCAESGAPVVNMISAYGGIRWGSGMSRMFQYEKTQSRLGATLWERPDLYIENSPIFNADKIETPVLILHNDEDGAVPWYQGIEFFTAMRRLGKPAWMLNYNGEPHWPVKLQNRKDFNIRMQQFFDHFLMDKPMPRWMKRGVPAIEKGILQGYELGDKND